MEKPAAMGMTRFLDELNQEEISLFNFGTGCVRGIYNSILLA
jgi:hypothetical protein